MGILGCFWVGAMNPTMTLKLYFGHSGFAIKKNIQSTKCLNIPIVWGQRFQSLFMEMVEEHRRSSPWKSFHFNLFLD
jgi:hypothetical protein